MKKIYTFLLGIMMIMCFRSFSEPVDVNIAKQVALNFMKQQMNNKPFTVKEVHIETSDSLVYYYTITFNEGGWVMVSANNTIEPILGYSDKGIIDVTKPVPDAFIEWTNGYKKQIIEASKSKKINAEVKTKWDNLLNYHSTSKLLPTQNSIVTSTSSYVPGTILLNTPVRGEVDWNQDYNNDSHCNPSYNQSCGSSSSSSCWCGHYEVGCGAVAMGEIMWYWQWPNYTVNFGYDWSQMPNSLWDNTSPTQANNVAALLENCGIAASMNYGCNASWTTLNHMADAFNFFKFNSVEKIRRSGGNNWIGDPAWKKFITAEIDAGRPVLYRGGTFLPSGDEDMWNWGDIHYFVCDGYNTSGYFHFNWGWGAGDSWNGFYDIDNLVLGPDDYTGDQMAIIGISPTCGDVPTSITDVPYTSVSGNKALYAYNDISLPASGKTLTVNSGANYSLGAGESIKLNSGFKAVNGSIFKASIYNLNCASDCGMAVEAWPNLFDFNYGTSDPCSYLDINVVNANTFELRVWNSLGQIVYINAGYISGNPVCVWNSCNTPSLSTGYYQCNVIFRDNCGEEISHTWEVCYPCNPPPPQSRVFNDSLYSHSNKDSSLIAINKTNNITTLQYSLYHLAVYPNPNNGNMQVTYSIPANENGVFGLYDVLGNMLLSYPISGGTKTFAIDGSALAKGVYIYQVYSNSKLVAKDKIVVIK